MRLLRRESLVLKHSETFTVQLITAGLHIIIRLSLLCFYIRIFIHNNTVLL